MIGFDFILGFIAINICLVDLLDLRYNQNRTITLLPTLSFSWLGRGRELIVSITASWLNLELNIIALNFNHYCDKLEEIIRHMKEHERKEEESKEE